MSMESWNQKLDAALTRASHEVSGLAAKLGEFAGELTLAEKGLLGAFGFLLLFYLLLPGDRGPAGGNPGNKQFAGILLLFVAIGVLAGLLMTGDISL